MEQADTSGRVKQAVVTLLCNGRGLALRDAERYASVLTPAELDAIARLDGHADHGPELAAICDEISDRLTRAAADHPTPDRPATSKKPNARPSD